MGRYLIILLVLFGNVVAFAQNEFKIVRNKPFAIYTTIGLKGGLGLTSIYNANMTQDPGVEYNSGNFYTYGFKGSLNYIGKRPIGMIFSLNADYMFDNFNLELSKIENPIDAYYKKVDFKTRSLVITGRYKSVYRQFMLEAGMQFNTFLKVEEQNKPMPKNYIDYVIGFNYRNNYQDYNCIVLGAGYYFGRVLVTLRQIFSITSLTADYASPVNDGYYSNAQVNSTYKSDYSKNLPTKIYAGLITIEYYLPFVKYKRYWRGKKEYSIFKEVGSIYYWGRSLD